jgi:aldose 1-epimerase
LDTCPSGCQVEITYNNQRAIVVEVGGGIRRYEVGGRTIFDPYPIDSLCDGARRLRSSPGRTAWSTGSTASTGVQYHVALTEPEKHSAIHGFLRWRAWRVMRTSTTGMTMGVRLHPMPGYPFVLDVEVDYSLGGNGLTVTTTATNAGVRPCPYGTGQHPYLSPGVGLADQCTLQLEAGARIVTDDEPQLPTGAEAVDRTAYDVRESPLSGPTALDFAFTDLICGATGRAWARLGGTDARQAELWVDESYPTIELYTGHTPAPDGRRKGLGAEPMTCPPNAFASGDGLTRLETGQNVSTPWGARLT